MLTAALTLALAVFGAQAQPTPAAGTDAGVPRLLEPLGAPPQYSPRAAAAAQASYPVRVRFDVVRGLRAEQDVRLEFSGTEHWDGKVERVEERNPDSYSVFGSIAGAHQGYFVFTVDSGGFAGTIQIPQENLLADLRNIEREEYWLHIFDGRKAHQFKCGVPPPPEREEPGTTPLEGPDIRWAPGDPVPQQDIMVLYTQGLLITFPNHYPNTPLPTAIQHFIDFSNQAYVNSGVQTRLRLVYRALVDQNFGEAGRNRDWLLNNLTGKSDGFLDHIHGWRQTHRADLVCLLYSLDTQQAGGGGLAWLMDAATFNSGDPANWFDSAFCVVEGLWEPSSVEPPVSGMVPTEFAHEIGHNQGLDHDCGNGYSVGSQVTPYAFGWRFTGNSRSNFITIMSYANGPFASATPIPHFANPAVFYDGQRTGNATSAGCAGTTGAKTAEALNLTSDFMSRLHLKPLDPWVDFSYAGLIQNGRFETPWKALTSAITDIPVTGSFNTPEPPTITIKGAASTGPMAITISKRCTLKSHKGPVTIGGWF